MLEELEYKFFLILVLVDGIPGIWIIIIFPDKNLSDPISKKHILVLFLEISMDSPCRCYDFQLLKDIKEGHVQHIAVHRSELNSSAVARLKAAKWSK